MPLALTGSMTAVQFRYPAELPLTLNKLKRFETGACVNKKSERRYYFFYVDYHSYDKMDEPDFKEYIWRRFGVVVGRGQKGLKRSGLNFLKCEHWR